MLRAHPEVLAALPRRGITDMDLVLFDVWAYGDALVPEQYATAGSAGATSGCASRRAPTRTPTSSAACT